MGNEMLAVGGGKGIGEGREGWGSVCAPVVRGRDGSPHARGHGLGSVGDNGRGARGGGMGFRVREGNGRGEREDGGGMGCRVRVREGRGMGPRIREETGEGDGGWGLV